MKRLKARNRPVGKGKIADVPVIMQMEAMECGAASLCMVLAYYDQWLPLERVRADCGVSRDGSSAKNILLAAQRYGLKTSAFRLEPEMLRENGVFPCIVHVGFSHFIVVCGFKGDTVIVNDPAYGRVKLPYKEFDKRFTGVTLMFEPTAAFEPAGRRVSVLEFAKHRLKGTRKAFIFAMLTTAVTSLIAFLNPAFSRVLLDRVLSGANPDWLYPLVFVMAGLAAMQLIVAYLKAVYLLKIEGKFAVVGSSEFFWHVLHLPMDFFSQRMAGDILARQKTNAGIASALIGTLAPLVLDTAMMLVYTFVLILYSPVLALIGLFSVAVNAYLAYKISQKRIDIARLQQRDAGKKTGATVSGIRMMTTIKASGAERGYFAKWAGYQAAENAGAQSIERLNAYLGSVPDLVTGLCDIAILGVGILMTFQGHFTVGMLLAFQGFINQFYSPVEHLIAAGQSLQEMRVHMERIDDVMRYDSAGRQSLAPDRELLPEEAQKKLSEITVRDVTFGYSPLAKPILNNLSFTLSPGKRIALVGSSGCGKSTISKLVSGLYAPWSGEILFDGKPLSDIPRALLASSLAIVDQDVILFEDSIRQNIKMWDESIADFDMILAARDAGLYEDIMRRRGGFDGKLLEGGRDLSGGQRQRMEIARVLAQDPSILILDEATSALDAKTEFDVVNAVKERGIACILIAHRLSTIRDCDEIIVLDHGSVVERGTHDELFALGGVYTNLVSSD